jgi:hypothetical protein
VPSRTTRQPSSRATRLRNIGFVVAVALGAVGIWLIVTGGSTQRVEIGVLTGLWGLLLGAICGRRMVLPESSDTVASRHPAQASNAEAALSDSGADPRADGAEVAVRGAAPVDRLADAEARRTFEADLQQLLRREVGAAVSSAVNNAVSTAVSSAVSSAVDGAISREIGELRAEIAQLRQELVDKVGGQLRLERIETTRLIGSDLEAMRAEVRRLKHASDVPGFDLDAELAEAQLADAQLGGEAGAVTEIREVVNPSPQPAAPVVRPAPAQPKAAQPVPKPDATPGPAPAADPATAPVTPGVTDDDPFASLPRLTPFTEFALDPVNPPEAARANGSSGADEVAAESDAYAGRRRHRGDGDERPESAADGEEPEAGRRHHRADDAGDSSELLARLLARENVRH